LCVLRAKIENKDTMRVNVGRGHKFIEFQVNRGPAAEKLSDGVIRCFLGDSDIVHMAFRHAC
jgi:hypothetical protein